MNKEKQNVVIKIENGSIAEELGVEPGDILVSINDKPIEDVFDYRYLINDEFLKLKIRNCKGEEFICEVEKDYDEDLGIIFESGLMDNAKSCKNHCMFCFIDQLPPNMRQTMYFKDDDSRLSFLQGNYVTLTNMKQEDIDRIIYYHLSPINISVHTTDMELRKKMLKNPNAEKLFVYIEQFAKAGIQMNCQVVLCKGINDKEQLDKTIKDLSEHIGSINSLSIVPVGLTRYREKLYPLEAFEKVDAEEVIDLVEKWQSILKEKYDNSFVFASDEFYLTAQRKMPTIDKYEDFPQIENGVGMMTLMEDEFNKALTECKADKIQRNVSIATGEAAYEYICNLSKNIMKKFVNTKIKVYNIKNNFFGGKITVAGLLTGTDYFEQLRDKELGQLVLISKSSLRADDTVFLDDVDIKELEEKLGTPIRAVDNDGADFLWSIIDLEDTIKCQNQ